MPKLRETMALHAGGPGSGCHGSNCGRPHGHGHTSFKPGSEMKLKELHGVPFKKVEKLTDAVIKQNVNRDIEEPELTAPKGFHKSAGIIMVEPDGRVWMVSPTKQYGGYRNTFPKGTLEEGEDPQEAAIREVWEESGLVAKIDDYLGDFQRSTSVGRFYIGHRVGGAPNDMGWESEAVKLVKPTEEILDAVLLNKWKEKTSDHEIAKKLSSYLKVKQMKMAAAIALHAGGPGSGCRGDNCGRPKGSSSEKVALEKLGPKIDYLAKKTGSQGGSNKGGFYKGSDGVDRYVKFYKHPEQGRGEALANNLYRDLGLGAPKSAIFEHDGAEAFASEIIPGGKTLEDVGVTKDLANKVLDGFVADILTGNWDAVGLTYDNILVKDGEVYRLDNGAAFLTRAQGAYKPEGLLNKITEVDGFFNPNINREYSKLANKAGYKSADELGQRFVKQVASVVKLRDKHKGWDGYVTEKAPWLRGTEKLKIVEMLESRTGLLEKKARSLL